ncbi:MAG: DUF350 domain-containing protein [Planctomycetaceae bacterium]|nr:MAG: DUF350 domain-containing protein [Planctomycetaceae bacterium]
MPLPLASLLATGAILLAQSNDTPLAAPSGFETLISHIVSVIVFSAIGVVVFGMCLWLFNRLSPFSLRKEIEEDQNTAVAIIIGALIIGMAIIIAAAVHG